MKKYTLSLLIAGLVMQAPTMAEPVLVDSYDAAQSVLQDDGYILFAYAQGWDNSSSKICRKLMNSQAVKQAAGNAVFMPVPVPNILTDELKEANKAKYGKLTVPDAPDYPAILMLTKDGRHYATLCGPAIRSGKLQDVAKTISDHLASMHKQEELLTQAANAKGVEKARLLGEAASQPGINPPERMGNIIAQIKKLDPNNETGYARKLINPFDLSMEIFGIETSKDAGKGWQAALTQAEAYLKDSVYNTEQKQALYAISIGIMRRHMGARAASKIREYARAMASLNPDNYLGQSAKVVERDWGVGLNLIEGWTPDAVSGPSEPIELSGPLPITTPGTYKVTFTYTRGRHSANIRSVKLYDGSQLVAQDEHDGSAGKTAKDNVYTLTVENPPKDPHLFILFDQSKSCDQNGRSDSYGRITITR